MIRILLLMAACYLALLIAVALFQRKLIYLPSHHPEKSSLPEWRDKDQLIGYARPAASPGAVWLFMHGNAGQAADRTYILPSFSVRDAVYILEYPGYGKRAGAPSMAAFNEAASNAYLLLRKQYPATPVCVASESIGSGPASFLATLPTPPDKIVLLLPFDTLGAVAARHYPFVPVKLLLRDNWDNIASLKEYRGQLEVVAARGDAIIPLAHARVLAESIPSARFTVIEGGHNDWADGGKVAIRYRQQTPE